MRTWKRELTASADAYVCCLPPLKGGQRPEGWAGSASSPVAASAWCVGRATGKTGTSLPGQGANVPANPQDAPTIDGSAGRGTARTGRRRCATISIVAESSLSATSLRRASTFADAWLQDCTASSLMSPGCAALPALPGYSVRLVTKVRSVTAAPALCTLRIRSGLRPTDEARCWSLRDSMGGNLESIREAVV